MKHALILLSVIATQAQAQIIYTDVIPDTNYGGTNDSCYLDLDNNGQADYLIIRQAVPFYCHTCLMASPRLRVLIFPMATNVISGFTWLSQQFPQCHQYGQVIGTNLSYSMTNGMMRDGTPGGSCPGFGSACVPWPPFSWAGFPEGYLGLRFDIAGATHYGWARLSIPSASGFTLKDYAYNGVPDEPIAAGETQCNVPFALAVNPVDSNSVNLTWQTFSTDTFDLRYRPTGTTTWSVIDTITTTNFIVAGLTGCMEYEFQVEGLCDGLPSGYSASFIHNTDGCCSVPSSVAVGVVGVTSGNVAWGGVTAAYSYDARISADGGTNWALTTGITTNHYEFTGLDSCTTYVVQVRTVCNGGTTDWSTTVTFKTSGCGACLDLPYCPSLGYGSEEWIAHVMVGTLNNVSGSNGGYGDFTASGSTQLEIGQGHPITLAPGYPGEIYPEYFKVFVDLDQDGDFNGPGELAYNAGDVVGWPISGTLNIPVGALHGSTRMRVLMMYYYSNGTGCTNEYDGETEDYCVDLVDLINGVGESPTAGQLHLLYPNPSDREIFFDASGIGAGASLRIDVLDGIGRTVASKNMDQGRATFTTSSLADGLYVYRITDSGVEVASGKFEVLH